jgi:mannose/cellobiose epimerase-like protein (N-acyl-D-glucosamine 2-epimerase family)
VLEYIQESIELLNNHALDEQYGGYINGLNRDLTVKDSSKRATPQLAPLSGYLAYLYPVTKNDQYLKEMTDGVDLILDKMMSLEEHWLMGSFDEQWQVNMEQSDKINVGHNLEIVWTLLRLHLLTGNESYKEKALELYPRLYEVTFNEQTGAWHHNFSMANNAVKANSTPWWVQAYGNMLELYLYRITEDQIHLDRFQQGADFWNNYFMDKEFGAAYLSVGIDGEIENGNKAVRSKTSYHSMEHGLLNYLYLNLWVQNKSVTLNFKIKSSEQGKRLYPILIEDPEVKISSVTVNGSEWNQFSPEEGFITLPELTNGSVQVRLSR